MSEQTLAAAAKKISAKRSGATSTFTRVARYTAVRGVTLFFTVLIGVYLTIVIANMGGTVDQIRLAEIEDAAFNSVMNDPELRNLPADVRVARANDIIVQESKRLGLDQPFLLRSFRYLGDGMTLNLGRAQYISSDSGSRQVRNIILERLPATLVLFATADLFLFFSAISIALFLSRRYGSLFDKMIVTLSPMSSAPGWFYGIFLILIFAALLNWLPFGGMVDAPPPDTRVGYLLSLLKHMILPVMAITLSSIFLSSYSWRTFFMIYSSEDYVEMAKAKGLNSRDVERRYVLRPTLPTIITSFALLMIGLWTGAPIFETVFNWPGLGRTLLSAVNSADTAVIVASTVIFGYLLAMTVFMLEFLYALVDPRVKIGGGSQGKGL